MIHDVQHPERGGEIKQAEAASELVRFLLPDAFEPTGPADVFEPEDGIQMSLVPSGPNQYEIYFEPDEEPSVWRRLVGGRSGRNGGTPILVLTFASAVIGLVLLGMFLLGGGGDSSSIVAGASDGTDTIVLVDGAEDTPGTEDAQGIATTSIPTVSTSEQPLEDTDQVPATDNGRSSDVAPSRRSTTTRSATSSTRRRTTAPATTTPTGPTQTGPQTTPGVTPTTEGGSTSESSSTVSAVAGPRIVVFSNSPAPDTGQCPEGELLYDATWNALDAESVTLTLPDGSAIPGTATGGHQLCGTSGQVLSLIATSGGRTATATTVLR